MTRVDIPMLSFAQAREEACITCSGSPCCRLLNLDAITLDSVVEIDYAFYLLNFDGIHLSLMSDMRVAQVFFHQSCSNLDPQGLCGVHGTQAQPAICVAYRSHDCGYKRAFADDMSQEQPLVDRARFAWLVDQMVFDEDRNVVARPFWPDVLDAFAAMPTARAEVAAPSGPVPVRLRGHDEPGPARPHRFSEAGVGRPCQSCPAWCCKSLDFPRNPPATVKELDFLRYALGFPSVEVKVTDDRWAVVVHTTCRHLDGGLCSVFNTEERPIRCRTYDEFNCGYKPYLGRAWPEEAVRIGPADFAALAGSMLFDDVGNVRFIPPIETIRRAVESGSSV